MNQIVIFITGFLSGLVVCLLALRYWFKMVPMQQEGEARSADTSDEYQVNTVSIANLSKDPFLSEVYVAVCQQLEKETFSIDDLAKSVAVSRSQLFRKIKDKIGLSPSCLVRNIRLEKAFQLLQSTELNVTQVAYAVGYKDIAHFSRCFRKVYGCTPKRVRKQQQVIHQEPHSMIPPIPIPYSFSMPQ